MGCCGQKRQALGFSYSELQNAGHKEEQESIRFQSNGASTTTTFRYTCRSKLEVEGIFRQRVYKFSKRTPELAIMSEDVAVMRAYPDLVELKERPSPEH